MSSTVLLNIDVMVHIILYTLRAEQSRKLSSAFDCTLDYRCYSAHIHGKLQKPVMLSNPFDRSPDYRCYGLTLESSTKPLCFLMPLTSSLIIDVMRCTLYVWTVEQSMDSLTKLQCSPMPSTTLLSIDVMVCMYSRIKPQYF